MITKNLNKNLKRKRSANSEEDDNFEQDNKNDRQFNAEIINKESNASISANDYRTQRVLDGVNFQLQRLYKKRRKDKQLIENLYLNEQRLSEKTTVVENSNISTSSSLYNSLKHLLTGAITHFSLPVLLLLIDQITKVAPKNTTVTNTSNNSAAVAPNVNINDINALLYK